VFFASDLERPPGKVVMTEDFFVYEKITRFNVAKIKQTGQWWQKQTGGHSSVVDSPWTSFWPWSRTC
jgi:hypothetical protein